MHTRPATDQVPQRRTGDDHPAHDPPDGDVERSPDDSRRASSAAEATRVDRIDGYARLRDYAALSDGRTVALVARDGRIDWWPLPTMDSPPVFAALLDSEDGGYLTLQPQAPDFRARRRYIEGTNVVETTFETDDGSVRVTDAITVGMSGPLPWAELVRSVEAVSGTVAMRWAIVPGSRFGTVTPWSETRDGRILLYVGDQHLGVHPFDVGESRVEAHTVHGEFTISRGEHALLAVTSTDKTPIFFPPRNAFEGRLERTIKSWQDWSDVVGYTGSWQEPVRRSALALKTLLFSPTGAIAAAPTTSLPERIGGDKNWDYRYMWVRDAAFTVDALINLGMHEEVQSAVTWLLGTITKTAPDIGVFYKLDGRRPADQEFLDLPGYRNSKPVRSGNSASRQLQLGTFGDLFDTVSRYVEEGHVLDPPNARLLADLADRCCDLWQSKDAGIWELKERQHYTASKIGCWTALDRAVQLHERGQVASAHAHRWAAERDLIKDWVDTHCWSEAKRSYTFYAGTDDLDAATLLAARTGFDRGERLAGTVDAVRRELAAGEFVYRYTDAAKSEGAFLACSFWLVTAFATLGRNGEARDLMERCIAAANDVGLFSEQIDPANRELLGNFPQGLTHLALINAAFACDRGRE